MRNGFGLMNNRLNYYVVHERGGCENPELRLRLAGGYSYLSPSDFLITPNRVSDLQRGYSYLSPSDFLITPNQVSDLQRGYSYLSPSDFVNKTLNVNKNSILWEK
jgi:hypothetical protein